MNRRKALFLAALSGGWLPGRVLAQDRARRAAEAADRTGQGGDYYRPAGAGSMRMAQNEPESFPDEPLPDSGHLLPPEAEGLPAGLPTESGQVARTWDISRYVSLPHKAADPQNALVEWIFRRTGSAVWHGERVAALSVGRARLLAYHEPGVLKQVEEVVERFINAQPTDILGVRVRFIAAADTRWRYAVASRLTPIASGPQGQQVWALNMEDAAMVQTQMQVYQGFHLLADQQVDMINGQTLAIERVMDVTYVSGPRRDGATGLGYQPTTAKLEEGVKLRISPLLSYEGDALDLALDLKANTVRSLQATRILARREIGPADMTIEVPEVVETRINQTIQGWKLGQTLLISAGIHPGILQDKRGFLNLRIPGTVPTRTELLVFLDVDTVGGPPPRTAARDRG